jgi:glycerate 2-kinase
MTRMPRNGIPTEVLVAPDKFKGTFAAAEIAAAIARGLESRGRAASVCAVADGGDGTRDALATALGAEPVTVAVSDPLGRVVEACFSLAGPTAIVEMAAASGLALVAERDRDPIAASTQGTGELIAAAVAAGAHEILVGVGGSATTDGGAGALKAIADAGGLGKARIVVLCDVRTAFEDAARVFGPQKGAGSEQVKRLTARLNRQARAFKRDPRGIPFTGAAGGLAGGLWAELGAELVAGAPYVLDAIGFDSRMRAARAVITGEGRLDRSSLAGKAVSEVATRCRQAGVPCHAVVGKNALDAFDTRILDLQAVLEAGTIAELERAGAELVGLL